MLKEYRFEMFINKITSKCNSIVDTKKYFRLNERWVNIVIWQLLYDRAISKEYKLTKDIDIKHHVHKDGKYYKDEEFKYRVILSK